MTLQDWGAVSQIVGTVAILVTLVYLASQVRYARLTVIDANRTNRVEGIRELNGILLNTADVRAVWNKTMGPQYRQLHTDIAESLDLSFDEASLIVTQGANWAFTHWAQYRSMKSAEDEDELKNIVLGWYGENPMRALMDHPNFRAFFDAGFIDWVDEILPSTDQASA